MLEFMKIISSIFEPGIFLPLIFIVGVYFFITNKKHYRYELIIASVLNLLFIYPLKYIINKPRPENMLIVESAGKAFPSGHSALAGLLTFLIIHILYRSVKNKTLYIVSSVLVFIAFLSIPYSRLYLHVHDIYDVTAGYILGALAAYIAIKITDKYLKY